jgi:hypothetical protein
MFMKRAKIMLLGIAVLSVVGGALAFKASSKFKNDYCILSTITEGRTTCSLAVQSKVDPAGLSYYYITTNNPANCQNNVVCTTFSDKIKVD